MHRKSRQTNDEGPVFLGHLGMLRPACDRSGSRSKVKLHAYKVMVSPQTGAQPTGVGPVDLDKEVFCLPNRSSYVLPAVAEDYHQASMRRACNLVVDRVGHMTDLRTRGKECTGSGPSHAVFLGSAGYRHARANFRQARPDPKGLYNFEPGNISLLITSRQGSPNTRETVKDRCIPFNNPGVDLQSTSKSNKCRIC